MQKARTFDGIAANASDLLQCQEVHGVSQAPYEEVRIIEKSSMPLSDRDLRQIIPEMAFETDDHTRPFDLETQVQPCSIDLRLDRRFWIPRRPFSSRLFRRSLDLRSSVTGEIDVRRLFMTWSLHKDEGITVKPGEMILGRTFEKFTVPNGFAGKLEGRVSFSRLGLSVHCTGDFINPGWRGRMPLQIVNHGVVPITLAPTCKSVSCL